MMVTLVAMRTAAVAGAPYRGPVAPLAVWATGLAERVREWLLEPEDAPEPAPAATPPPNGAVDEPRQAVLVVDASGSMLDEDWPPCRLDAAKRAAKQFVARLATEEPEARVVIVAYGSDASVEGEGRAGPEQRVLHAAIDRMEVLGTTNIRAGVKTALHALEPGYAASQVVVLSDGHNTDRDPAPVAAKLRRRAVVECVGIGGSPDDVDETLLRGMASERPDGSKRYRWIGDGERLVQHFHRLAGRIRRS